MKFNKLKSDHALPKALFKKVTFVKFNLFLTIVRMKPWEHIWWLFHGISGSACW